MKEFTIMIKKKAFYRHFCGSWISYRKIVNDVFTLVRENKRDAGISLYKTTSRNAYNLASDTLGELTDINVAEDQEASDRAAETYRWVRFLILLAMLLGALMVMTGVLYIRRSISDPILRLAGNMHRLAGNDMDIAINATERRDELGEMARAVLVFRNNMIDLALSREGLAQQASMLEEKLEHERSLAAAQRNFITMASHEFRTPLNIIDGHAQRLMKMKGSLRPADITERTEKMRDAVKQISDLIDNLINSTLLFEGKPELYFHPTDIDVTTLLHDVCHQHREIVPAAYIVEKIGSALKTFGDPKLLRQVFGNLLANAIKYSADGGLIEVSAKNDSGYIIITVRDHGIGIPQKDMGVIFDRYIRGSNVSDISGTGIGLYVARMIVELHEGIILVESIENSGSLFTVRLPAGFLPSQQRLS